MEGVKKFKVHGRKFVQTAANPNVPCIALPCTRRLRRSFFYHPSTRHIKRESICQPAAQERAGRRQGGRPGPWSVARAEDAESCTTGIWCLQFFLEMPTHGAWAQIKWTDQKNALMMRTEAKGLTQSIGSGFSTGVINPPSIVANQFSTWYYFLSHHWWKIGCKFLGNEKPKTQNNNNKERVCRMHTDTQQQDQMGSQIKGEWQRQ